MLILDTNVISELMRAAPEESVFRWSQEIDLETVYTTAITEAEIMVGIALKDHGRRRNELIAAARVMFEYKFAGRILAFESLAAQAFAEVVRLRSRLGRPIDVPDAQIAAICVSRKCVDCHAGRKRLRSSRYRDHQSVGGLTALTPSSSPCCRQSA